MNKNAIETTRDRVRKALPKAKILNNQHLQVLGGNNAATPQAGTMTNPPGTVLMTTTRLG